MKPRKLQPNYSLLCAAFALVPLILCAQVRIAFGQDFRSSLVVGPYSLSFGDVQIGKPADSQTITLLSTGMPAPRIDKIEISAPFTETTNCPVSPATLAKNQTCGIEVVFDPTMPGSASGMVSIFHDGIAEPIKISLSGTGTAEPSSVKLSSTSLTFGEQTIGTPSPSQTVTLTSSGDRTLLISSISVEGDFTIMPASTCESLVGSVAAHANCTVVITFTPLGAGKRTGAIVFKDDAPDSPQRISLTGTGSGSGS
ncbi:MAG TPA: choice-of-anchor D domain-containing protein [Candidatus Acidoferrales bacterium]|nr:choice-of-anchor D domain-containing protein [Candidatus Acidoferrales bacterium]